MRSNLPNLKRENRNDWYWARDLLVNGITVGRGGGNISNNVVISTTSMKNNVLGTNNVVIGTNALLNNVKGTDNIALGANTLNVAGGLAYADNGHIAIGSNALSKTSISVGGIPCIAIGTNALANNVSSHNLAIGHESLSSHSAAGTGSNTAIGTQALKSATSGSGNVAIGYRTLYSITSGYIDGNTAIGSTSLTLNTTGLYNCALGQNSLGNNTTGSGNSFFGYNSGFNQQLVSYQVGVGYEALKGSATFTNNTGTGNTAIGYRALYANANGTSNVAMGYQVLYSNVSSYNNTSNGYQSAYSQNNQTITAGSFVVGASYTILTAGTTDYTLIGSVSNSVGIVFTATGVGSGTGTATLNHQTSALGYQASYSNLSGHSVTALGVKSLYANTAYYNVTGVGANTAVTGSNQVQLGDSATTTYAYGAVQDRSDARDKADIRDTTLGLAFIESLRPVDFKWDKREDYRTQPPVKPEYPVKPTQPERVDSLQLEGETDEDYKNRIEAEWQSTLDTFEADYKTQCDAIDAEFAVVHDAWLESNKLANITHDGTRKRNRYHHGVIAQEVQSLGVEFGGLQHHLLKGGDDVYSIGYEEFIAPLIKAVQELSAENKMLKAHLGI